MGLIKEAEQIAILTDIQGLEDHFGDMDFKVAGTSQGITALQMDIKIKGVSEEVLGKALAQAKAGRLFILDKMLAVLPQARPTLSLFAPRIITHIIHPDRIRDVIGPGGKMIKKILTQADLAPELGIKIVDDKKKALIGQMLIAVSEMKDTTDTDFSEMVRYSSKRIKAISNELPEDFSLKITQKENSEFVSAIDFAIATMKYFVKLEDQNNGQKSSANLSSSGQNIVNNGMLFAAIVWDKYTNRHTFGQLDPKTVGKKLSAKVGDAEVAASLMSAKKYNEAFSFFFRIIRTKETNVLGLQK